MEELGANLLFVLFTGASSTSTSEGVAKICPCMQDNLPTRHSKAEITDFSSTFFKFL